MARQKNSQNRNSSFEFKPLTNCMATAAWLTYLKKEGYSNSEFLEGIDFDEEFLLGDNNWISSDQCYLLAANIAARFPADEHLFQKMALWSTQNRLSKVIWTIMGSIVSPHMLYKSLPKRIMRFNRHRKCELLSIGKGAATIRFKHMTHVRAQKCICEWTEGLLAAGTHRRGLSPGPRPGNRL